MGFRTVVITKHVTCSYKNGYLVLENDDQKMIHLSEVDAVIFDTMAFSTTGVLLCQLVKQKIAVVFCDEHHLPLCYLLPLSAHHASSRHILLQSKWNDSPKSFLWSLIVKNKICKQAELLLKNGYQEEGKLLISYIPSVLDNDKTNREAFAAKVYFNVLFGKQFSRDDGFSTINAMLNYGYAILLSLITREIVAAGYLPQMGIHHCNEGNPYNLACDLMEPFRPIVDNIVFTNKEVPELTQEVKEQFWGLLQLQFSYGGMKRYLASILHLYVHECLGFMETGEIDDLINYKDEIYAFDGLL